VPVGKITRTHGIRGAVKIYAYGESLGAQAAGSRLYAEGFAFGDQTTVLTIRSLKAQGRLWVAFFEELASVDEAQKVVGAEVFLPEDRLPTLAEDEFYHYQLIGLTVETREGKRIGILRAILETGSNDVYVVDRKGIEILVPALEDVIHEVDLERRRMVIDVPEGLMDDL